MVMCTDSNNHALIVAPEILIGLTLPLQQINFSIPHSTNELCTYMYSGTELSTELAIS